MAAGQAAAIAQDGGVDCLAKRGADNATRDATAQGADDSARDGTKWRDDWRRYGTESDANFGACDDAGQRAGDAASCAGDGANRGSRLLGGVAVHPAPGMARGTCAVRRTGTRGRVDRVE